MIIDVIRSLLILVLCWSHWWPLTTDVAAAWVMHIIVLITFCRNGGRKSNNPDNYLAESQHRYVWLVVGISIQLSDLIHYEQLTSTTLILSSACSRSSSWWSALTFPELAASMSIILPGVHTMISAPRFNSAICSEIPVPPVNLHHDDEDEYVERILWGWWRQLELHPQSTSKSSHWEWKHRGSKNQRSSELSASMVHPSYWEPRMILKGWQIDDRWQMGWSTIKRP